MFETITQGLTNVFRTITGKAKITETNIADALREVRVALLEADVNLEVARTFIERVKDKAMGEKVLAAVDPGQQFIKIVHDELAALLGGETAEIRWNSHGPTVIMLCGLQGCGKTTTVGKLATRFKAEKRRPLLVAADVRRPAAIRQLQILGEQVGVPVYAVEGGDPVAICAQSVEVAKFQGNDVILLDTAGRLHIDDELMTELERIVRATQPQEILFVCDAMIGQSAVDTAVEFQKRLPLTGAILTKLDTDTRGGGALSLREVTGIPIKFVTVGEKMDALEPFHPVRMAGRILGMGDVVALVEKAQSVVDQKDALLMQRKLLENRFTLEDFRKQMQQLRRMGSLKDLLALIPGIGSQIQHLDFDENQFKQIEAIIQSMTPEEREHPEIIDTRRKWRIAAGSGCMEGPKGQRRVTIRPVSDLLKQFAEMKKVVGKLGKRGLLTGGLGDLASMSRLMQAGLSEGGQGMRSLFGTKKSGTKMQQKKDRKKRSKKRRR